MKTKILIIVYIFFITSSPLLAQHVKGYVKEKNEQNQVLPLVGANVYWLETHKGTVTDVNGFFNLKAISEHDAVLIVSYIGYVADTIVFEHLHHDEEIEVVLKSINQLKEVTIKSSNSGYFSMMKPINTQVITSGELRKAACCNLSESFVNNASIDVSYSDAISGAKQIQLLGLAGIYSQMMSENIPNFRGLANGFGLLYVPGPWMESIQISKGTSSVVNGFESISGQINVEYKKPETAEPLLINGYTNNEGRFELNAHNSFEANNQWKSTMFAHTELQSLQIDHNHDMFLDVPMVRQLHVFNRWDYENHGKQESKSGFKFLDDQRKSGQVTNNNHDSHLIPKYVFSNKTQRIEAFTKNGFFFSNSPNASLGTILSASYHKQDINAGNKKYFGEQKSLYANIIYENILFTTDHKINTGMSFLYDDFFEKIQDSTIKTTFPIPGAFFQYTFNYKKWMLLAGYRADYYWENQIIHTPRLHVKYAYDDDLTFRLSAGKGYRIPHIIAENPSLLLSSRNIAFNETLKMEEAVNYGGNFTKKFEVLGEHITWNMDFYRTDFMQQTIIDMEVDSNNIAIYNLNGKSYSNSFQTDVTVPIIHNLEVTLALRMNDVKTTLHNQLVEKPYMNKYKGLVAVSYKSRLKRWAVDANFQYNGKGRLPQLFYLPEEMQLTNYSPDYSIINAQITRSFKYWEIYVGCENIGNFVQRNPIIDAPNPFSNYFDASQIWGPISGRMFYGGFRYIIRNS